MTLADPPLAAVPRAAAPRLAAVDCLQRGLASAWANRELVLVAWLQAVAVTVLLVLAFLAPLVAVGIEIAAGLGADPATLMRDLPGLLDGIGAAPMRLAIAVLAAGVLLVAAVWLYSWFQAGIFGVLTAAERQAPPGWRGEALAFRTFSLRHLAGWGGRWSWRFFGFYHLAMALALVPLVATFVLVVVIALAAERWGGGAAFGVGCGGALPVGFLYLVLALWMMVAQAELADAGSGVLRATRRGLEILGRRLGATLLLVLLFVTATMAVVAASLSLTFTAGLAAGDDPVASLFVTTVVSLLEWLAMGAVGVVFAASMVALVRSEIARGGEGLA